MSLLGQLFGKNEVIESVINTGDALVLTKEEKLDKFGYFLKLYEPFKLAQRFLALICSIPYVLAWFLTFVASFWTDVSMQVTLLTGNMGQIVWTIVGFYFLGGAAESFFKKGK